MTRTVDERLAAALHEMEGPGRHSRPRLTRQICPGPDYHDADAAKVLAALADSGVVLVERTVVDAARDIAGRDDFDVRDYEQGLCFFCGAGHEPEPGPRGGVKGNRHLRPVHEPSCAYVALRAALRESR